MKTEKTFKALNLNQDEIFEKDGCLIGEGIEEHLDRTDKNITFLTGQVDKHQARLNHHLSKGPEVSRTAWEWVTGSLNFVTFGFFDWLTNGTISSFDTQKFLAKNKYDALTDKLINNVGRATEYFDQQFDKVKATVTEIKELMKQNSDRFVSDFEKKVKSMIASSKEGKLIEDVSFKFYDNKQDAMAFHGFQRDKNPDMHVGTPEQPAGGAVTTVTHSYKDGDKAVFEAKLPKYAEVFKNYEKLDEFLHMKYSEADAKLLHYSNNHDGLEVFVDAFGKRLNDMKNDKQIIFKLSK